MFSIVLSHSTGSDAKACCVAQIRRVDTEILGAVRQQSSSGTRAK